MLKFHILNVGHGDSAVIEYESPTGAKSFGLVDSNKKGDEVAPALRTLQRLGATRLAFIVLTHEHADHYKGMLEVMDHFGTEIDAIYTYPLDRSRSRLQKLAAAYLAALEGSENEEAMRRGTELLSILANFVELNEATGCWETPTGDRARLHVPSMPDVEISAVLPHAGVRGDFYTAIENGRSINKGDKLNELSLALRFEYGGHQVILGADGTYANWMYVRKRTRTSEGQQFGSTAAHAAKLPHHGSEYDCAPLVLDYIYGEAHTTRELETRRIAIISADGRKHPSPSVLRDLQSRGIEPYCTGLSRACSGQIPIPSVSSNVIDPQLVRAVAGFAEPSGRPPVCQGNITLSVAPTGQMSVTPEYNSLCLLR